jgi:hypothetical protein
MQKRIFMVAAIVLLMALPALAKSKDKVVPPYILAARTVAVVVDPKAGIDIEDPRANQIAQKDVETALGNWGRFQPVVGAPGADLIIVIRRGHGRMTDATISDPRQNDRGGMINPTDNGVNGGVQNGRPPSMGGAPDNVGGQSPRQSAQPQFPQIQAEMGGVDDSFMVYDGTVAKPLDGAPGWRYVSKDGLRAHGVPAVEEFRKVVAAADKAAAAAAAAAKKP